MEETLNDLVEFIKAIPQTPTKTAEGRFVVNVNAARAFQTCINDFANMVRQYNYDIHENLLYVKERMFIPATGIFGIPIGDYIIDGYYFGLLDAIVTFINADIINLEGANTSIIKADVMNLKSANTSIKPAKIFISHAENDQNVVKHFVDLLRKQGVKQEHLFCSSYQGFGIPLGEKIYDYLRSEFARYNLFVIFMLSNNYYSSPACLNEMGATWVNYNEYQQILLPGFNFDNVKGAIEPSKISFKLDDKENRKYRLTELKDSLLKILNIDMNDQSIWEHDRDAFLSEIDNLH